jgi:dephospho-CoA kinase
MKVILITGLDGSGKSTLLDKLEKTFPPERIGIVRVPHIRTDGILNPDLLCCSEFVNHINALADKKSISSLKMLAVFCAMVLFEELLSEREKAMPEYIFCERHPLIDSRVYGSFYLQNIKSGQPEHPLLAQIGEQHPEEINYILSRPHIRNSINTDQKGMKGLLTFLKNYFESETNLDAEGVKNLFRIPYPDKIIFLQAAPEILLNRLKARRVKEAHESAEILKKMIPLYEMVLNESGVETERVDADDFSALDLYAERLCRSLQSGMF